jgi:hypothetical protein
VAEPDLLRLAALNNAEWCDLVAGTHGLTGTFRDGLWSCAARTPDFYPDAVTLRPAVPAPDVLAAVDAGDGCSVKDSFADLPLEDHGFGLLLEGRWFGRLPGRPAPPPRQPAPPPPARLSWSPARTVQDLADFAGAWAGGSGPHPFRPALLDDPRATLLTGRLAGAVVAGAALNDTGPVTGVCNVFGLESDTAKVWAELDAALTTYLPGRPLVGWASADDIGGPLSRGFRDLGALRVWLR